MPRPFLADWRNAIRDSGLPRTVKLVAHTLATYMNASGHAFPSLLTLATGASLGRGCTAVKAAIATLEDWGYLEVDRKRGRFGWSYQAVIPRAAVGLAAVEIPREPSHKSHGNRREIPRPAVAESAESAERGTAADDAPGRARVTTACDCRTTTGNHQSWCRAA